jgi:SAM-dependent methyltransferase
MHVISPPPRREGYGEPMTDGRRVYYDHEQAYRRIRDSGGRGWDDLFEGEQGSYIAVRGFLAEYPPTPGASALDLGCGGGQAALDLARAGYRVTGIDYAETAIELARRNAADASIDATFTVGDALHLPFDDGALDLVIDNHLLHCIVEPADRLRVLAECHRVLARDGVLWSETMWAGGYDPTAVDADAETGIARNRTRIWIRREVLVEELVTAGFVIDAMVVRPSGKESNLVTRARRR